MGNEWGTGTRYVAPVGCVWWPSYTGGRADDPGVLLGAAAIRNAVPASIEPPISYAVISPSPGWADYGFKRVLVWNGGAADRP
jgi:hypothetical protein